MLQKATEGELERKNHKCCH